MNIRDMTIEDFEREGVLVNRIRSACAHGHSDIEYYQTNRICDYLQGEWLGTMREILRSCRDAFATLRAERTELGASGQDPNNATPDFYVVRTCLQCDRQREAAWHELHWDRNPWERRSRFVEALCAFPCDPAVTGDQEIYILTLLRRYHITKFDFKYMDEYPSHYAIYGKRTDQDWHWKLRQVRNNVDNNLYAILDSNEDDGYTDDNQVPVLPHDFMRD